MCEGLERMDLVNLVANDEERFYAIDLQNLEDPEAGGVTISEYLFSLDFSDKARLKGYDAYLCLTKIR